MNEKVLAEKVKTMEKAMRREIRKALPGHRIGKADFSSAGASFDVYLIDKELLKHPDVARAPKLTIAIKTPTDLSKWGSRDNWNPRASVQCRPSFVTFDGDISRKYKVRDDLTINPKYIEVIVSSAQATKEMIQYKLDLAAGEADTAKLAESELKKFAEERLARGRRLYGMSCAWWYRDYELDIVPKANGMVEVSTYYSTRAAVWPDEIQRYLDLLLDFEAEVEKLGNPDR